MNFHSHIFHFIYTLGIEDNALGLLKALLPIGTLYALQNISIVAALSFVKAYKYYTFITAHRHLKQHVD